MVRSRQLASVSARSGPIRLTVTAVERRREGDGALHLVALHGVNGERPWRLTMPEVLAALGTGRYVFEVAFQGERRRAEVLGTDGGTRLFAPSPVHGDLLDALPDIGAKDRDAVALAHDRQQARSPATSGSAV